MKRTLASDNYAGVHPDIMNAIVLANRGHASSYGADEYCERAVGHFRKLFGEHVEVFFVYNGTGANVTGLQAMVQSFHSIICSDLAHINVDESTAPEKFLGAKLITIPTQDGKIYPDEIERKIQRVHDQHHPQARVVSISQTTEYATVYSPEEVQAISSVAKKNNLLLHMDGSRISNAAAALDADFRSFTIDAGVDVLSFGGTKIGMMFGEAVVFLNPELGKQFKYIRKQGMQLHSKMRFIGCQFDTLLQDELWKRNALHANAMARYLEQGLRSVKDVKLTQRVEANGVFAVLPKEVIPKLQEEVFFYVWNERTNEVRMMCSFDTQKEEIDLLIARLKELTD